MHYLKQALFKTGSYVIDSAYFQLLNTISNHAYKLYIKGYTDT